MSSRCQQNTCTICQKGGDCIIIGLYTFTHCLCFSLSYYSCLCQNVSYCYSLCRVYHCVSRDSLCLDVSQFFQMCNTLYFSDSICLNVFCTVSLCISVSLCVLVCLNVSYYLSIICLTVSIVACSVQCVSVCLCIFPLVPERMDYMAIMRVKLSFVLYECSHTERTGQGRGGVDGERWGRGRVRLGFKSLVCGSYLCAQIEVISTAALHVGCVVYYNAGINCANINNHTDRTLETQRLEWRLET